MTVKMALTELFRLLDELAVLGGYGLIVATVYVILQSPWAWAKPKDEEAEDEDT